jgi:hypothetical protein
MGWRDEMSEQNTNEEDLEQKLLKEIQALGNTADEVANTLRTLGCKGQSMEADSCPIARYLILKGYKYPCVTEEGVTVETPAHGQISIKQTEAAANFVKLFDDSAQYEDLDSRNV